MESMPGRTTVHSQPLIAVRDVRASSHGYRQLLGLDSLPEHRHRDVYERMFCAGHLVLQLHAWDEHDHPNLVNADAAPLGHGVLLWFEVDDFDSVVERARALRAQIIEEPHLSPRPNHREVWLRDTSPRSGKITFESILNVRHPCYRIPRHDWLNRLASSYSLEICHYNDRVSCRTLKL